MSTSFVILIEDSWGYVFGGYCANEMVNSSSYYGSGESFVFSVLPAPQVYRWTGKNELFIISSYDHLAMVSLSVCQPVNLSV